MQNHTPTPWKVNGDYIETKGNTFKNEGSEGVIAKVLRYGATRPADANAAFIVTACNAHDELVAALQNARNVLAGIATGDLKTVKADSPALKQIREALAKAGIKA